MREDISKCVLKIWAWNVTRLSKNHEVGKKKRTWERLIDIGIMNQTPHLSSRCTRSRVGRETLHRRFTWKWSGEDDLTRSSAVSEAVVISFILYFVRCKLFNCSLLFYLCHYSSVCHMVFSTVVANLTDVHFGWNHYYTHTHTHILTHGHAQVGLSGKCDLGGVQRRWLRAERKSCTAGVSSQVERRRWNWSFFKKGHEIQRQGKL